MDDESWQRRAWAARVLGRTDRAGAGEAMTTRLAIEPDARVQKQLRQAISVNSQEGSDERAVLPSQ